MERTPQTFKSDTFRYLEVARVMRKINTYFIKQQLRIAAAKTLLAYNPHTAHKNNG